MKPIFNVLYAIKKISPLLLITIFFLGYIPLSSVAQNNDQQSRSVNISVNATVIGSIELTTIRNMQFGRVQPGQQIVDISPTQDAEAGKMVASGIPNSKIRISYNSEWELTNTQSSEPITFNYRVAGSETDDQDTAELLEIENRDLNFNSDGNYYFWIGGSTNISNVQPGNYEGEFTIEIEYI